MLELDDLDLREVHADAALRAAARVQLGAPQVDRAIADPLLQGIERDSDVRVQQGGERQRFGCVHGRIEQEISVGPLHLVTAVHTGRGVAARDPRLQLLHTQLIGCNAGFGGGEAGHG